MLNTSLPSEERKKCFSSREWYMKSKEIDCVFGDLQESYYGKMESS
jgi:hypothetical protein